MPKIIADFFQQTKEFFVIGLDSNRPAKTIQVGFSDGLAVNLIWPKCNTAIVKCQFTGTAKTTALVSTAKCAILATPCHVQMIFENLVRGSLVEDKLVATSYR